MLTVDISLPDVEELHKLVQDGLEAILRRIVVARFEGVRGIETNAEAGITIEPPNDLADVREAGTDARTHARGVLDQEMRRMGAVEYLADSGDHSIHGLRRGGASDSTADMGDDTPSAERLAS